MHFLSAELKNFRNFKEVRVDFSTGLNVFLGANGQGKTNFLEALYFLTRGTTFRYGQNVNLIRLGSQASMVNARAKEKDLLYDLSITLEGSRKTHSINEKKVATTKIAQKFGNVLFSPESLSSIKEGSEQRRILLDELLMNFSSANVDLIAEFKKALRTRNRLLKNHAEGLATKHQTMALLEALEPSYLKLAGDLCNARIFALRQILPEFSKAMSFINQNSVDISVEYVISDQNAISWDQKMVIDALQKRIQQLRDAELDSGASLVGPQKHDVKFLYNQNDSRIFCSQGQQRALILSFKMAQIVYHRTVHGIYPVLMLDDVLSE
ncbi:MAG: DNA replication/repair protein RecF, partial [Pseudobdellovibrionaceae bacterium]